ncbi:TrmH family RNA methyltransferase [Candidatus Saccharibacteria bacterium]|nr:TrmH family RNA methyltransferase [Candidatus Saccharibacteria bacterium]MCA9346942.1 TrmH family RNA methyltransferase [Candidatus Saccharibacteria bacterium]
MHRIIVIAHNIRSAHNVGSLLRTAEGLGINEVVLSGYSPYPRIENDHRLPHIAERITKRIHKTALGAENSASWRYQENVETIIADLKSKKYAILGLEQAPNSKLLPEVTITANQQIALLLGSEVDGIESNLLSLCDEIIEIPMEGKKESFNVVEAATMAMYHFKHPLNR